ncbi:MAG: hypothetical protein GTO40_06085, partial [Deltaproteobacteria bacterium]|nr:hypothetical protein [Deltaproteobacteria bacterium]
QYMALDKRRLATGYYSPNSGAGLVFRHFPRQESRRIGLLGMGAGTLALYARPQDTMRIYEINPEIRRFAESYFTYLKDSPAKIEIVMGDGRLAMERDPSQEFDILLLDAFTGDAIPVHLLTVEAFQTYLRHLTYDGVIAILIDTYHLNFEPVIRRLASHLDLDAIRIDSQSMREADWGSSWMILTRNEDFLDLPAISFATTPATASYRHLRLWTDDYTSLFPLLEFDTRRDRATEPTTRSKEPPEPE